MASDGSTSLLDLAIIVGAPIVTIVAARYVSKLVKQDIPLPSLIINAAFPFVSISAIDAIYNTSPQRRLTHLKTMALLTPMNVGGALFWEYIVRGGAGPVEAPVSTGIVEARRAA